MAPRIPKEVIDELRSPENRAWRTMRHVLTLVALTPAQKQAFLDKRRPKRETDGEKGGEKAGEKAGKSNSAPDSAPGGHQPPD